MDKLPEHLRAYIVEQSSEQYTPEEHAVWRYILRELSAYLAKHAHPSYLEGLEKTGIHLDRIPSIREISDKLSAFGWRALPVSGFIPPAVFMELQAHGVLPIATNMRSIEHLAYTPAPDIVHEAAGHAPMLINPEYSAYLKKYATCANKAIFSEEDLKIYSAIRHLSDIKENPSATKDQIIKAERDLKDAYDRMTHVSEANELARMNWWTAEYGLIGDLTQPKIYGAGLLSSVGESRWALNERVKKIPLSLACIEQGYDITEPQPQLFVTPDFNYLNDLITLYSQNMAYQTGGFKALSKALKAKTVNTVEWNSGLQVGGILIEIIRDNEGFVSYLRFSGPCQLAEGGQEILGQGVNHHPEGFGSPVGKVLFSKKTLEEIALEDFSFSALQEKLKITEGRPTELFFTSQVRVKGIITGYFESQNKLKILSFKDCEVKFFDRVLFSPDWGVFDMAIGSQIKSVYSGPPDRQKYGQKESFEVVRVPKKVFSEEQSFRFSLYDQVAKLRHDLDLNAAEKLAEEVLAMPEDWLLKLESLELIKLCSRSFLTDVKQPDRIERLRVLESKLRQELEHLKVKRAELKPLIEDGLSWL